MPQTVTVPFNPEALEANRAGRLTDGQREHLRRYDRGVGSNSIGVAVACVVLAVFLFRDHSSGANAWLRPAAGVVSLVIAVLLVLRRMGVGGRLARDLRSGRVESIEGPIARIRVRGARSSWGGYLEVAGKRFRVFSGSMGAAPDAGIVRLYYLPASRHVVNLERLPDRPLPEGAAERPVEAVKSLGPALFSRDRVARAEARATLAALGASMELEHGGQATPPPITERDPRPLAQAIVGRWRSGPMSLQFADDGTVVLTFTGGREQRGRWRVDAAGRLHADAIGGEQIGDAWVVGDTLTVSMDGEALTFRRS